MKKFLFGIVFLWSIMPCCVFACTSWMVFSDMTQNGTNILHKNRDAVSRKINLYASPADSKRKWIGSGNNGNIFMGINNAGLAVIMNNGEVYANYKNPANQKKTTPVIIREALENCDTAAQAVKYLQKIIENKHYYHVDKKGSIYFFCDTAEGYVCEITDNFCSVQRYDSGSTVRANIWQNPGMYQRSRSNIRWHLNSSARAYIAISGLNAIVDKHGKISLLDIFDLTRHCEMPESSPEKRSVCFRATNSTASFEIDKQYPEVLSSMYATVGHPRHTVYVPVPVCAEKFHPAMTDLKWSTAAWKRFDELKLQAPIPAEWTDFEKDSMAEYSAAKARARKLLDSGKRSEAIKLMNSTAEKIWLKAAALLKI